MVVVVPVAPVVDPKLVLPKVVPVFPKLLFVTAPVVEVDPKPVVDPPVVVVAVFVVGLVVIVGVNPLINDVIIFVGYDVEADVVAVVAADGCVVVDVVVDLVVVDDIPLGKFIVLLPVPGRFILFKPPPILALPPLIPVPDVPDVPKLVVEVVVVLLLIVVPEPPLIPPLPDVGTEIPPVLNAVLPPAMLLPDVVILLDPLIPLVPTLLLIPVPVPVPEVVVVVVVVVLDEPVVPLLLPNDVVPPLLPNVPVLVDPLVPVVPKEPPVFNVEPALPVPNTDPLPVLTLPNGSPNPKVPPLLNLLIKSAGSIVGSGAFGSNVVVENDDDVGPFKLVNNSSNLAWASNAAEPLVPPVVVVVVVVVVLVLEFVGVAVCKLRGADELTDMEACWTHEVLSGLNLYPLIQISQVFAKIVAQFKQFCTVHIGLHCPFSFL